MAELYWVGRGSPSWRDRRNWSRRSGGKPGTPLTAEDVIVLDGRSPVGRVDLAGAPSRGLRLSGFRGVVVLPSGAEIRVGGETAEAA